MPHHMYPRQSAPVVLPSGHHSWAACVEREKNLEKKRSIDPNRAGCRCTSPTRSKACHLPSRSRVSPRSTTTPNTHSPHTHAHTRSVCAAPPGVQTYIRTRDANSLDHQHALLIPHVDSAAGARCTEYAPALPAPRNTERGVSEVVVRGCVGGEVRPLVLS